MKTKINKFKIAIKFGDNDFGNTFRAVLVFLYDAYKYDKLPEDKEKLCWLINNLSPIAYVSNQNQWVYNGLQNIKADETTTNSEFLRTKQYLQITTKQILLNEEVDKYIKSLGKDAWDNSETFILDTSLFSNNIYSI